MIKKQLASIIMYLLIIAIMCGCKKELSEDLVTKEIEKQRNQQVEIKSNVDVNGDYIYNMIAGEHELVGPSFSQIEQELQALKNEENSFVVLESEPLIQNVMYIQVAMLSTGSADSNEYVVEMRIDRGEDKYSHYRYITKIKDEVIKIFKDFYEQQIVPDYTKWEDVTREFE